MVPPSPRVRVRCHVRPASLVAPVDATLRHLEELNADGVIDDFTVGAWPAEVRLDDPAPHSDVVDRFEAFDAWAEQWGVSIRPPFAVETRHFEIIGETRTVLITPVQCLAVYVDGALKEVFPHSTDRTGDGETYTVRDALPLLEARAIATVETDESPETPPSQRPASADIPLNPATCPACETQLVSGQGVVACPNCDWTDITTDPGRYHRGGHHASPFQPPGAN